MWPIFSSKLVFLENVNTKIIPFCYYYTKQVTLVFTGFILSKTLHFFIYTFFLLIYIYFFGHILIYISVSRLDYWSFFFWLMSRLELIIEIACERSQMAGQMRREKEKTARQWLLSFDIHFMMSLLFLFLVVECMNCPTMPNYCIVPFGKKQQNQKQKPEETFITFSNLTKYPLFTPTAEEPFPPGSISLLSTTFGRCFHRILLLDRHL